MNKSIFIKISGKVQNVGFRYATKKLADQLGLVGRVRNTEDWGVEILAQGSENNLKQLLDWCRSGPPNAQVEKAEAEWTEKEYAFENFVIT